MIYSEQNFNTISTPIDTLGRPTTYLTYLILDLLFRNANEAYSPDKLSLYFACNNKDVENICEQLATIDFISRKTDNAKTLYQYNYNCSNEDLQINFETFLADIKIKNLPIESMIPYSPSCP